LNHGRLDEAERDFRRVLQLRPQTGGAYANLGVVHMRRKEWGKALENLEKAERLMPQVAGIRLNIGLAYYRQNEFAKAIPVFESVVRDQPDAAEARNLRGQCYFFTKRWADAASTLEPLWAQHSEEPHYLYMLSKAAHLAGQKDLDERAWDQLMKVGDSGAAGFHLLMGNEFLQLGQWDSALGELQIEAQANPNLPYVHYYLGQTYLKKQEFEHAREEFLKDAAIEPNVAANYDELGETYWLMQDDANAEKSYREALLRDPGLANSHLGLARIYQRQEKYAAALVEIDSTIKLDAARSDVHYMRGQVLLHLDRKDEAKKEVAEAARLESEDRAQPEKHQETAPSPALLQEPQ